MKRSWLLCAILCVQVIGCISINQSNIPPLETPSFDMPDYFTPHPALIFLGSDYSPQMQNHSTSPTLRPIPKPDLTQHPEFVNGIFRQYSSPYGNKVVVISFIEEPSASILPGKSRDQYLEEGFPVSPEEDFFRQGWLVNLDGSEVKPLFATYEHFEFRWIDSRYGLMHSFCYGELSIEGLHIIDTKKATFSTIDTVYGGNCEGGLPFSISLDAKHLIVGMKVVAIINNEQTAVCIGDEFARSYTWSLDGRYVFIACASAEYDHLHRYDTLMHEETILAQNTGVAFKAIKMWLSPDQEILFFEWGTNRFFNAEEYGVWIIDLTQLDK